MHSQDACDPLGRAQQDSASVSSVSTPPNVQAGTNSQMIDNAAPAWHGTGELSFRLPTMVAAAQPPGRHGLRSGPVAARGGSPEMTAVLEEAAGQCVVQGAEDRGNGSNRVKAGARIATAAALQSARPLQHSRATVPGQGTTAPTVLTPAAAATAWTGNTVGGGSMPSRAAAATGSASSPGGSLPPPPPPPPLPQQPPGPRRRRRSSDDGDVGAPPLPQQPLSSSAPPPPPSPRMPPRGSTATSRPILPRIPSAATMTALPPDPFSVSASGVEALGRSGAGAGPRSGGAAASAAAATAGAAAAGYGHGAAMLQQSLAITAAAFAAHGGGLRRRTGSHGPEPSPQISPTATSITTSSSLRNCTTATGSFLLGRAQDEVQPLAPSPLTRTEAALPIRLSSGGGGGGGGGGGRVAGGSGGDGDGSGGGGRAVTGRISTGGRLPPDGNEHQRLSWGSYTEGGGGSSGRFGCLYEGDDGGDGDHRPSWGSYYAVPALQGSGGGVAPVLQTGTHAAAGGDDGGGYTQVQLLPTATETGTAAAATHPPPSSPDRMPSSSTRPTESPRGSAMARQRWQRAVAAVGQVQRLHRQAQTLADKESAPTDRLFAALSLALQRAAWEQLRVANPHRRLLRHYVEKKAAGRWGSSWERLEAEFVIAGTLVFDWCTPARMGEHWPLFTAGFLALVALLFAFMAAQYPYFAALEAAAAGGCSGLAGGAGAVDPVRGDQGWSSCFLTPHSGPGFLLDVLLRPGAQPATRFSGNFLQIWGGLYLPAVQDGQAFRWITAQFIHASFRHAAANLALTAALGWQMEVKYGTVRVMAVWVSAVVGGELLAAAVEDPCRQVVGCSGGAFGLLGLFCADTLLHYPTLRQPILRCAAIAVLLGFLVYTMVEQQGGNVSSMTHVGGLLCGLLPSLLVLPRLGSERWEAAWPALGLAAVLAWFSVLPAWVYTRRLPYAALICEPIVAGAPPQPQPPLP